VTELNMVTQAICSRGVNRTRISCIQSCILSVQRFPNFFTASSLGIPV